MPDALAGFCRSPFWDLDFVWNGDYPDFTECFQSTILVWVPIGFLIIGTPFFFRSKCSSRPNYWSVSIILKLLTNTALLGLAIAELVWLLVYLDSADASPARLTAAGLNIFAYVLIGVLMLVEKKNGSCCSIVLFYFWLFQSLASLVHYYSQTIRLFETPNLESVTLYGLQLAVTPLVFLMFLLHFVADKSTLVNSDECPERRSAYISQLVFAWLDPMLILGYKEPLTQKKLWRLEDANTSEKIVEEFNKFWDDEMKKANKTGWDITKKADNQTKSVYLPSFMFALIKCYWFEFLIAVVQKTISDLLTFVNPQMLSLIISYVSSDEPLWKGILYSIVIFICAELQSLFLSQYFMRMYVIAMRIRIAIISAVYKKALRMSNKERQGSTVGEIVNLMSIDTQRFVDLMPYVIMLYSAPLQIVLALYFLSNTIGISVVGGVVVMVLLAPINAFIATVSRKLQIKDMKLKDERTKLMNEILNGIKVLKLYAWEIPFGNMVQDIRNKEVNVLKKLAYYMAGISFVWTCAPFLVSLASFTMYVLVDDKNILTANVAFVSLSLFNLLRFPLNMLPSLITALIQVSVSIKRLNKFLRGEEIDENDINHHKLGDEAITIENGNFSWGGKGDNVNLSNINLNIKHGKLVAVVGQVGSGKSSLISAMLGEMYKQMGKINLQGSVAYVPQQAWIQNASVKNNILMYKPNRQQFYDDILAACSLKTDLEILPGGDQTEIGEKGINLSGGQKQRVSLARAVYHDSSIYLLDDPLSAVDSHVGKHIFNEVIGPNGMLKNKTRILVTNGISYLPQCDTIVVLKDGAISEIGSYEELLAKKGAFSDFLVQYLTEGAENLDEQDLANLANLDELLEQVNVTPEIQRQISKRLSGSESEAGSEHSSRRRKSRSGSMKSTRSSRKDSTKLASEKKLEKNKLTQEEKVETAEVSIGVYIAYLKRIGVPMGIAVLALWIAGQASSVGSNVWLSEWSNDPVQPDGTADAALRDMRLGVYGALGIGQGLGIMLGAFGIAYGSMRASSELHKLMLDSVLKSPMSFFDTTPIGRIVNRFSKDINVMDVSIVMNFRGWIMTFMQVVSIIIVDVIETPLILVVLAPASLLYYFIQKVYIASSRQLKRLESVTRSPIYNHFSESVTGASSIRAYGVQDIFIKESHNKVDTNMICYYPSVAANRWLAVRLEFVGNLIVLFASLFAVLSKDTLNSGSVGLSVSYAMNITSSLNWMVRMSSELETNIVSVERILEYSTLESEADWNRDYNKENVSWPQEGRVAFQNYETKYRKDLDVVLKGINCNVESGEKVGICGRTGAGKSSLTLALFRIIEASHGNILIDDVDISKLGLHNLRSRLTIIPQDPVLFSGNLRQNLDPFGKHSDPEIWTALELAHLKAFVTSVENGLDYEVAEGGDNLSVGQRQLICLARALLRKTKILVLDEATAAIDLETDDLIQETIRKEFADCTILTIAHRLNTIMDSTRIMVLDQGKIAEYDAPQTLLQDKNTIFYGMAKDAGLV